MIDWNTTDVSISPLTTQYSDEFIEREHITRYRYSQTEGLIKLVTKASLSVYVEQSRDCFIQAKLPSKTGIPKFETISLFTM